MFSNFENRKLKVIDLNGDKFWLTIPPETYMDTLRCLSMSGTIKDDGQILNSVDFPTFVEYATKPHSSFIYYLSDDSLNQSSRKIIGNSSTQNGCSVDANCYPFRPCLIPVGKDGAFDKTFASEAVTGSIYRGGYLRVTGYVEEGSYITTDLFGKAEESNNELPEGFKICTNIGIEDVVSSDKDTINHMLEWWFVEGCLICTTNVVQLTTMNLKECGLIPRADEQGET